MHYCPDATTCGEFESHVGVPFVGKWACGYGGAGAPCPDCNKVDHADPADVSAIPPTFKCDLG